MREIKGSGSQGSMMLRTEDRSRAHGGSRSDRVARSDAHSDAREEGEINGLEKASQKEGTEQDQAPPSHAFLYGVKRRLKRQSLKLQVR
ncbi:unnamed protein product [Brassica napus]|uniref:(rape) hypothetical protein n=1 Tax=Brassica napus TaxID=3708 RepID=A0A816J5I9_BRANA|nr:unnamed protein product [Brassica napus]